MLIRQETATGQVGTLLILLQSSLLFTKQWWYSLGDAGNGQQVKDTYKIQLLVSVSTIANNWDIGQG